jgi:hypothetical protein
MRGGLSCLQADFQIKRGVDASGKVTGFSPRVATSQAQKGSMATVNGEHPTWIVSY